jgi:hypothetical protein
MRIARFFSRRAGKSRRSVRFAAALGGLALTGGMILVSAPPAMAAGCWEDSCTGKDPVAMGCAGDAITEGTSYDVGTGGTLYLRFSPSCMAAWAKVVNAGYWPQKIWVHNTDSQYQWVTTGWFTGSGYTNMVQDGPDFQAQACADNYPCTRWY